MIAVNLMKHFTGMFKRQSMNNKSFIHKFKKSSMKPPKVL